MIRKIIAIHLAARRLSHRLRLGTFALLSANGSAAAFMALYFVVSAGGLGRRADTLITPSPVQMAMIIGIALGTGLTIGFWVYSLLWLVSRPGAFFNE